MAIIYTDNAGLAKPDRYSDEKETFYGDALDQVDRMLAGYLPVINGDANYTLQDVGGTRESRTLVLKLTSTLTAARNILIDTTTSGKFRNRFFLIWNATGGGFKVTVKTTAGGSTGIDITNGKARVVWHDGTNVYALSLELDPATGAGPAGTGTVTSIDGANGLETTTGSPITGTGNFRGAIGVNSQTGTSYTLVDGDRGKLVSFSNAAAIAAALPQAGASSSFVNKWYCWVENRGAGTLTITPTTSTIDGAASLVLQQNQGCLIVSDGTNYFTARGIGPDPTAWTAYTPTWTNVTVGNGTVTALYKQIGKIVFCRLSFVLGSTSAIAGDIKFSLPAARSTIAGIAAVTALGTAQCFDSSALVVYEGVILPNAANTTGGILRIFNVSGAYIVEISANASVPFTWTNPDELACEFFYEAA